MRIITGKFKGKKLSFPIDKSFRPTKSIVREALFSSLSHQATLNGAIVADVFCGTGVLAIEALSRGASKAILVDNDQHNLNYAKHNLESCGSIAYELIRADATNLPKSKHKCDIIFIDAPYKQGLTAKSVESLIKGEWTKADTILVIELSKDEDLLLESLHLISSKYYGGSKFILCKRK